MYKSLLRRHLYSLQAGKARLETDQKASTIGSSNVEVSIKHSKFLRSLLGITHLPSSSNSNQNHLLILTSRQVGTKLSQIIRPFFSHSSTSTTYFKMISSKVLSALFPDTLTSCFSPRKRPRSPGRFDSREYLAVPSMFSDADLRTLLLLSVLLPKRRRCCSIWSGLHFGLNLPLHQYLGVEGLVRSSSSSRCLLPRCRFLCPHPV